MRFTKDHEWVELNGDSVDYLGRPALGTAVNDVNFVQALCAARQQSIFWQRQASSRPASDFTRQTNARLLQSYGQKTMFHRHNEIRFSYTRYHAGNSGMAFTV